MREEEILILKEFLQKVGNTMVGIHDLLEENNKYLEGIYEFLVEGKKPQQGMPCDTNIRTVSYFEEATSVETEFFQGLVDQYLKEAIYVDNHEITRKSGVRVGRALLDWEVDFFQKHLPQYVISKHKRFILVEQSDEIVAMIRVYSDLGFTRGENWRKEISNVLHEASLIGCPPERVYFVVSSWMNGVDNSHVKDLLDIDIKNKDLFTEENKPLLEKYIRTYIRSLDDVLPNPEEQIFYCAYADLHPNVHADLLYEKKETQSLNEYKWLQPSISKLLNCL